MSESRTLTLAQVLPHKGRMLLLDELLDYGPQHAACGVTIRPDSMFCAGPQGVPSWVGLEYMAQTACAYSGIEQAQRGVEPSIALLLGARRFHALAPAFRIGARLRVVAKLILRAENDLVAFDCAIYDGARAVARADVKAIRPGDISAVVDDGRIDQEKDA